MAKTAGKKSVTRTGKASAKAPRRARQSAAKAAPPASQRVDFFKLVPKPRFVGKPVKRKEDVRLITGAGHYVDDLRLADMLHVEILRSPHAHARIVSMEVEEARKASGVVGVFAYKEISSLCGDVPLAHPGIPDLKVPHHPVLADGEVNFVGEPAAAVVAESRYAARDAVDLIRVEYEPLPAVVDPEKALAPDAPKVHKELADNLSFSWEVKGGDLDEAFKKADRIIQQRVRSQRLIPCALETRGVIAQYLTGEEQLTVWTSTQIPHILRTQLSGMLKLPESKVRVVAPEVGGGFGSKLNVYAEEGLLSALARLVAPRPVKWIETRRENMAATTHGRDQIGELSIAACADGTVLGVKHDCIADIGAYHQLFTAIIPTLTGLMLAGSYRFPAARTTLKGVFTNKMPTDAYRGAGRPEATFIIERIMDLVAAEFNLDPVEVRRKNFARKFPFSTPTGLAYDTGDYEKALNQALKLADYQGRRARQAKARDEGRLVGIGLSTYVEICSMGPSKGMAAGGWESATVRVSPTGSVEVLTGTCAHGQGQETVFAQITADVLGIEMDQVKVQRGDTGNVPWGVGTFGSRATAVGGTAVFEAARRVLEKMKKVAAAALGASAAQAARVQIKNGKFWAGKKSLSFAEVAFQAHRGLVIPEGETPGLEATYFFEPGNFTFPFGAHICQVEVDRDTGEVSIQGYWAVDDCGKPMNPLLIDGQVHGGIAQGLGQALYEEAVYDESGQLLTGTLMDYAVPKATHMPWLHCERTETPTDVNPLGVKGVGEAGTIGSTPAIVNAVIDALRPLGIKHLDMPLRPEKVWRAIKKAAAAP
ncbi:MAG: xanthine dehydrogenase family protein molybdopterin-binding subunit [Planctomycetes bacterium]|nr:xanthine dehydrogenase family protein molybdopterin-binding subunit [Planctomycetota bacterium]